MNVNVPNDPNNPTDRTFRTGSDDVSNDPDGAVAHDARPQRRRTRRSSLAPHNTVTWFFDGVMDRAEQYDSIELAMARADEIRGILLRDGWKEA